MAGTIEARPVPDRKVTPTAIEIEIEDADSGEILVVEAEAVQADLATLGEEVTEVVSYPEVYDRAVDGKFKRALRAFFKWVET